MRQKLPRPDGYGLAMVLAALTFAVVVLSALFLVYQPGANPQPAPFAVSPAAAIAQLHGAKAPHPDHSRANAQRLARSQHPHHRVRA